MGTGSTIFADESGDESATDATAGATDGDDDRASERPRSIFRRRDEDQRRVDRPHVDSDGEARDTDRDARDDDARDTDRDGDASTMLVYDDGERRDFDLDG